MYQQWYYANMFSRSIIILDDQRRRPTAQQRRRQRRRRRRWIPPVPLLCHLPLMLLMIIVSVFWFDVCRAWPSPGLLNIPPTIVRTGSVGVANGDNIEDNRVAATSTGNRAADIGAIDNVNNNLGDLLQDIRNSAHIVNLTRHHDGDVFRTNKITKCNADTCVGLSSGTAGVLTIGSDKTDSHIRSLDQVRSKDPAVGSCDCRCLAYLSTYREDLGICVDDIHECTLSPFVSGSSSEKIPFVFLPLRGQIIYPSREISFPNIRTPVCAVTGAQYLTTNGWSDLRNPIDADYPFRMFRDEGRTFIQWLGESDLRRKMQGRLIVVHLVCRDMMFVLNSTKDAVMPPKNVFSSCVAFRVNGSPVKYLHNVSEVLFQPEATSILSSTTSGMSAKEYIVIGVCSLLLGLIYVSSVFLYLYMKKRKTSGQCHTRNSLSDLRNEINYPKNDQVTFGVPFNRTGSIYSVTSISTSVNDFQRTRSFVASPVGHNHLKEEIGIVKNNPLLQHFPNFADHHSGFTSDISNSNSECEMESTGFYDKRKQVDFLQTSALVHPSNERSGSASSSNGSSKPCDQQAEPPASPTQENECLPEENVSIVEDIMNVEKFDSMRALVNGTVRKKLYFNPAYFEPELLVEPPPAAIEFLTKIREVIAIAKYKMSAKRYQPSLVDIPEESSLNNKNVTPNSAQQASDECKGCVSNDCSHTRNCGDKRNSIEKWLQTVPHNENEEGDKKELPAEIENVKNQKAIGTGCGRKKCSPTVYKTKKEMSPPKQRAPQPPIMQPNSSAATPKTIFHALKTNECQIVDGQKQQNRDTSTSSPPSASIVSPKTTINIRRKNDGTASTTTGGSPIYSFPATCIELHSNSKFSLFHESPGSSQRSHASSHRSKSSRKRLEVLDQYNTAVTPTSLASSDRKRYEALRDMRQAPNRVYEAIAKDCNTLVTSNHLSNGFTLDIPTPDYDSTLEKKIKDIYNTQSTVSAPSVPTPDYSTLSKKSLRQCQPDSPIYRRRSPQYLIVDYETDSLERLATSKRKSSQSSSSPSSDVSSQLSPSLSTALPLEEEVEVRHTIYDKIDGFRKDGDSNIKKMLSSSSAVVGGKKSENGQAVVIQKEVAARIKYDTPFRGSMTIEVEHEPQSDLELSTDSDQFEPDTLDRKPKKHSFCDVNAWTEHMNKSHSFVNNTKEDGQEQENYACLNKISELSNVATRTHSNHIFRSGSSFRNSEGNQKKEVSKESPKSSYVDGRPTFGSLREIYQSRVMLQNAQRPKLTNCSFTEKGRLLTLEAKHTRRQQITPPQVEPPAESHESTKTEANSSPAMLRNEVRSLHALKLKPKIIVNDSKNPQGWNTTNQSVPDEGDGLKNNRSALNSPKKKKCVVHDCSTPHTTTAPIAAEEETTSNHSESTEITGVSDTQANSEFEDSCPKKTSTAGSKDDPVDKCDRKVKEIQKLKYERSELKEESMDFSSRLNHLRNDYSLNKYLNRKKSIETDGESDSVQDAINNNTESNSKSRQFYEDLSRSQDAVAMGLRSNRNSGCLSDRTKELYRNAGVPVGIAYPQRSVKNNSNPATNVQMVYRCEVVPVSNGMQIAMGLKDRAKKSKDLRNAWRKFVGMAASRFSPPSSYNKKSSAFLESLEKDEGISSLIDELPRVSSVRSTFSAPASHSSANLYDHRYGSVRQQEMDSGYMSADSSEVHNRRFYDRYNFKLMTGKDHIIRVDTIKDNSDCDGSGNEVERRHSCLSFKDTIRASLECKRNADRMPMESPNRSDDDDGDSDKTLTATSDDDNSQLAASAALYSSEDEQGNNSHSYGSSETDEGEEETNTDDMWESGAESIETHSVLYKNIRKNS